MIVDVKEDELYTYTAEDVDNYLKATERKKTRASKSSAKLTALKLVSSKQQSDSDDDVDDDSADKLYTGEDVDSNDSDDNDNVLISFIQREKDKMKRATAQKKKKSEKLTARTMVKSTAVSFFVDMSPLIVSADSIFYNSE